MGQVPLVGGKEGESGWWWLWRADAGKSDGDLSEEPVEKRMEGEKKEVRAGIERKCTHSLDDEDEQGAVYLMLCFISLPLLPFSSS